jgi:colicin import membrane protein
MYRALVVAALTIPAAACASAQARTPIEPVSLDVPVVPPRLVETVVIDVPPAPPVEEPAQAPVPAPATRVRPANRDPNRGEARPDPKPEPEPEPAATPVAPPVPPLRTGTQSTSSTDETKRQIQEIVQRARGMLEGINTQGMSEDRLANYESAKDSILRAEAALKIPNLVLAKQIAERAENIAKLLISRQVPD